MIVAVISHTRHFIKDGKVVGWEPTVKELNYLANNKNITKIIHLAPLHKETFIKGTIEYNDKVRFIDLKPSGGKGLMKFSIVFNAPRNLLKIHKHLKEVDVIQFRAPTGIGIYVLPYLRFFNKNKYWVKYAGNWKDVNMPIGNKFQKFWLKNFTKLKTKVTVNGLWSNEKSNILPFENPCLNEEDRAIGKENILGKKLTNKINFCFVGALNTHKGVDKILNVFKTINNKKIGKIHFVGDGKESEKFKTLSKEIKYNIIFHGFLSKDEIRKIYKKSHFLLLPSKSEGFPKVVSEAMNFGCIPIVSNVSCIDQYIKDNENGFLINLKSELSFIKKTEEALNMKQENFDTIIHYNYNLARKFTYKIYTERIVNDIIKSFE